MADDIQTTEQESGPSLDDTLSAAFDAMQDGAEEARDEPQETPEPAQGEDPAATDEGEQPDDTTPEDDDAPADEAQALEPHPRWSEEQKAAFANLPRDAQEFVLSREKEQEAAFTRKSQELAEERKSIQGVRQVLDPLRDNLQRAGVSEGDYITRLVEADRFLQTDPQRAIQWLAQQAGVDLAKAGSSDQSQRDPVAGQLQALQRKLETFEQRVERERAEAEQSRIISDIDAFANEKDSKGTALRPYWADVEGDLMPIVAGLKQTNPDLSPREILTKAYDQAVWANPTTRAKLIAEQQDAKAKEQKAAADKAKKAAGVNVKGTGAGQMRTKAPSIDDTMSEVYDRVAGG